MSDFYAGVNDIPWFREAVQKSKLHQENHNHITRDIKNPGECYGCDRYWATHLHHQVSELRNVIYGTLDSWEDFGAAHAHSYLTQEAQRRNINRYEND